MRPRITKNPSGGLAPTHPSNRQSAKKIQKNCLKMGRKRELRTLEKSSHGRKNRIKIEPNMRITPANLAVIRTKPKTSISGTARRMA